MRDFRPDIHTNLSFYRGIVEDPDRIESLNIILNELEALGFGRLVPNLSTQRDPDRASDILFEISMCQLLRRHLDIQDLQYEPPGEVHPPDFRFQLRGVSFDLKVKQLHNTMNEMTKRLFERESRRHLSRLPKPWFINFWVADHFTPQHLNDFFAYLKGSLDQFSPVTAHDTMLGEPQYRWEQDGRTLVQFSFAEKRRKEPGIFPGIIYVTATESGSMAPLGTGALRKGVERLLRKARPSLIRPASPTQANLLVLQAPNTGLLTSKCQVRCMGLSSSASIKRPARWSASVHQTAYFGLANFPISAASSSYTRKSGASANTSAAIISRIPPTSVTSNTTQNPLKT